jgi:predicted  nucleic acid-binding Zn-ribbon protein
MIVETISALAAIAKARESLTAANNSVQFQELRVEFLKALGHGEETIRTLRSRVEELSAENHALERTIADLRELGADRENYDLIEVARGVRCYVAKDENRPPSAVEKYCVPCFDQGAKSLLQQARIENPNTGRMIGLDCPRCRLRLTFMRFLEPGPPTPARLSPPPLA